jgi:hypothetical protein
MNPRRTCLGFQCIRRTAALTLALAAGTRAQPLKLEPVRPGFGDVGPVAVDLRVGPMDLRTPGNFDTVYRLGHRDIFAIGPDRRPLVRINGATVAVFPRSVYGVNPDDPSVEIPPGTIFYIGRLPDSLLEKPAPIPPPSPFSARLSLRALAPLDLSPRAYPPLPTDADAEDRGPVEPCIMTSEALRRARVAELLRSALRENSRRNPE